MNSKQRRQYYRKLYQLAPEAFDKCMMQLAPTLEIMVKTQGHLPISERTYSAYLGTLQKGSISNLRGHLEVFHQIKIPYVTLVDAVTYHAKKDNFKKLQIINLVTQQ